MPTLSDPVAISVFGLSIRWYAVFILAGMFVAIAVLRWLAIQRGMDPEIPLDAAPWIVFAALIGARFYYLLLKPGFYLDHPEQAINVRLGGLTVHGAIVGGVLALWFYSRRRGEPFLRWGDLFIAVLPIGQAIGRWGNWANQEAFGTPTSLPWAVTIDPANRPPEYAANATFHPAFLYESLLNLLAAVILISIVLRMPNNRSWREGDAIWIYFMMYGSIRLLIESIRTDSLYIGPLPAAYWFSGGLVLLGLVLFVSRRTIWPGAVVADDQRPPGRATVEQVKQSGHGVT